MDKIVLKAQKRELQGRKVSQLRKQGVTPANLYGKGIKSVALQFDAKILEKILDEA